MRGLLTFLLVAAAVVVVAAAGWFVIDRDLLHLRRGPQAETAAAYKTSIKDIRTRLKAGERISLIVDLKLSFTDDRGKPVPVEELERAKAPVVARLSGRGIESARSIPYSTSLQVVVASATGLRRVLSDPMVLRVWEEPILEALVDESRVIVHATGPWNDAGTITTGTPNSTPYDGAGFSVAILDTGVEANVFPLTGPGAVEAEACFSTPSGYTDTVCPNWASPEYGPGAAKPPCPTLEKCDHGTHVAGIAVGTNSTANALGVAPGANIVAVQVFSNVQGVLLAQGGDIIAGLGWVLNYNNTLQPGRHKIVSVNMSLGGGGCSLFPPPIPVVTALTAQGVTVVAATGNNGDPTNIIWPACAPDVVSVGATNKWDVVAAFSNSSPPLDLLAPGVGIDAIVPSGTLGNKSGTSMAAPHVAGCVALLADEATMRGSMPPDPTAASVFTTAMKATGLPITDWRAKTSTTTPFTYGITTPRLDCGAALWNLAGKNHLATISGKKVDANGNGMPGWLIEAYSVGEPWPVGYVGHPSYTPVTGLTGPNGDYQIQVPWGVFQLGESPYGPMPSGGAPQYWEQTSGPDQSVGIGRIDVNPTNMGPFPGNDFVNEDKTAAVCPAGQDYNVLVADQKDHFAMPLDHAAPDSNLKNFFVDRYSPHPPLPMEIDENNWSTRAFIHTFDLAAAGVPANHVVTDARFGIGFRPVVQPLTKPDGTYIDPQDRLERNDAIWLLFPDANGGILGNPTAWGRGIAQQSTSGPGSMLGQGLLEPLLNYVGANYDYPSIQNRVDLPAPPAGFRTGLPASGSGLPNYVDADIRPMINLHRQVGLFFQDDTGVDYAAMRVCTRVPGITISKEPTEHQFNTGYSTTFDLTVTNVGSATIPSSGQTLQVSDELPPGFELVPNVSGVYATGDADWSCKATVAAAGGPYFVCKYQGPGLAANQTTTIHAPVKAILAGTHQNCASVDLIDPNNGDILDHNDACSVNAVGYDIGVRKRKTEYQIKWDNPDTAAVDPGSSVEFNLSVRNFGQELSLPTAGIRLADTVTHTGFEYIPGSLVAGSDWLCGSPSLLSSALSFACDYTGASLNPLNVIPPGFEPDPLQLERGFELPQPPNPRVKFEVRGNETGWWANCAYVTLTSYTDEIPANDDWCVNVFVQGNIAVEKKTGHANHEYDFDVAGSGQSEVIDLTIDVSNLAGKIDAPLKVEVFDKFPAGFHLANPAGFATLNPNWSCAPLTSTSTDITCTYTNLPIAGAGGFPIVPVPLDPIKLNLIASKPGIYQNCAVGDIKAGPTPIDDQPDEISPPDPPPPIDTDFDRTNNKGCTLIIVGHDVRMFKSASNMMPDAGAPFNFTFSFSNHWSSIGPNEKLVFTDTLPWNGAYTGSLPSGGVGAWNCIVLVQGTATAPATIQCTFDTGPTLSYGAVSLPSLSIPVIAPLSAGPYENCADLDVQLADPNDHDDVPANNTHRCVTINVPGHLGVIKEITDSDNEYDVGETINFNVTITNPPAPPIGNGSVIASPITITFTDELTPPMSLNPWNVSWPGAWGCSNSALTCTLPSSEQIDPGDTFTIPITATASTPGYYTNCFGVTLGGAVNVPDPAEDCVSFYVGHDVSIAKTVDDTTPGPPYPATVTFTLQVSNNLSSVTPPEQIAVRDTLPPGLVPQPPYGNDANWQCFWISPDIDCTYIGSGGAVAAGSALPAIQFQALVTEWGALDNCATDVISVPMVGVIDDILTNNGPACASVKLEESYLAIYKVVDNQAGATIVPSTYASGLPIELTCSSFSGIYQVPIKDGFFSSNDPSLTGSNAATSMSGAPPSTVPTVPGTTCTVSEAPLAPISAGQAAGCNGASASWATTYSVANNGTATSTGANVSMVASQTTAVTVTNTLKCDSPGTLEIHKVVDDQTGGTTLPSSLTSGGYPNGFPIWLECSSSPGIWSPTYLPATSSNPGFASQIVAGGTMCTVAETTVSPPANGPLPQITTSACVGSGMADWTTTYSPSATATVPSGGTATITVTNTLTCVPPTTTHTSGVILNGPPASYGGCPGLNMVYSRADASSIPVPYLLSRLPTLDTYCSTNWPGTQLLSIEFKTCSTPNGPVTADLTCG